MIITKAGLTIRMAVADLRVIGRVSQGVRLIKLNEGDAITSVAKIDKIEGAEEEVELAKPLDEAPEDLGEIDDTEEPETEEEEGEEEPPLEE